MRKSTIKRAVILFIIIIIPTVLLILFRKISSNNVSGEFAEVTEGNFKISVNAVGELFAENSMDIRGPVISIAGIRRGHRRRIRATGIRILDIVPEGTEVKKGDYIAQLDRTNYENNLKDELERLKEMEARLEMKMHDTALTLTKIRSDIKNQLFDVETSAVTLKQSKYEPPATIRRAEMALDKEKRGLKQKRIEYKLRLAQESKEINNIRLDISNQLRLIDDLEKYLAGFTILSPSNGMVIYKRNWNGTKRKAGYTLNPFDMVVATLPDLSSMISKTYISEIDINKVEIGQKVNIEMDAFPGKSFEGTVTYVGKTGEQLSNSDTKMFEVNCRLDQYYSELRPSMTTNNEIIIKSFDNVVFLPLECVHTDAEGFSYVFTKNKTKQIIELGESNDKYIIVNEGLTPGTLIYLSAPEDSREFRLTGSIALTIND
jgi:multidrug efflux pump subunit AcrA (membrane-fusion protein)